MKRLIDKDPLSGIETWHYYDPLTDKTTIETVQDVEPFLDYCQNMRSMYGDSKDGLKAEWWHYALLPDVIIVELKKKHNVDLMSVNYKHDKAMQRKFFRLLNSEYKRFKITELRHNIKN